MRVGRLHSPGSPEHWLPDASVGPPRPRRAMARAYDRLGCDRVARLRRAGGIGLLGIHAEYLDKQMSFPALTSERKTQLARIAGLRNRDVLVYAADLRKGTAPIAIQYEDLLPFTDQLLRTRGRACYKQISR
jgi:hypothetical protein